MSDSLSVKQNVNDAVGIAKAGSMLTKSGMAAKGLSYSNNITKLMDLGLAVGGGVSSSGIGKTAAAAIEVADSYNNAKGVIQSSSTAAKIASGASKAKGVVAGGASRVGAAISANAPRLASTVSKAAPKVAGAGAKVLGAASKAAPVLGKVSAGVGVVLGGVDIARGVNEMQNGDKAKGKEQITGGICDVITSGALAVAAATAPSGIGPAIALGVAGVAQVVKYRGEIAEAGKFVGGKVADGASWLGGKLSSAFNSVSSKVGSVMTQAENSVKRAYGVPGH